MRGDDIIDALLKEWDIPGQQPSGYTAGNAWVMLPNPRYDPDAPERVVEHLLLAARGRAPDEEGVYFTGRTAQLDQIVAWMRAEASGGLLVVTGPAGCGKSALVGRIVSLSNPVERASLLEAIGSGLAHADPGERSVHAHAHARGLTAERLAEVLDDQLVRRGVLARHPGGTRNRWQLLGDLQAVSACPVIVIDGLDETGLEAFRIAEDLVRLSGLARVIVTTRDLPSADGKTTLVATLAPTEPLDLGDEALRAATEADVRNYIDKRLHGAPAVMDRGKIADAVIGRARGQGEGVFLLARVVTSQLRAAPIDTALPGWEQHVARSFEAAFQRDLALIPPLRRGEVELPQAAGELLAALAWAYGAGFPDDVWPVVATALSATGIAYDRADVFWVLGQAGRYIVEDGQGGRAVYRLSHQRLVDHLRQAAQPGTAEDEDRAARVAERLVEYYQQLLTGGLAPDEPAYLWRYLWRYCVDGGQAGIDALRSLAAEDSAFLPDLAMALSNLGIRYSEVGLHADAIASIEEAVRLYRDQAANNHFYLPDLAGALTDLGVCYSKVGRNADAIALTEEAVTLYRALAEHNAAYLPDLARALNNLGACYREVGRRAEAITSTEEAIILYRALAEHNAAYLPSLAGALNNLGICYREVGRRADAITPTGEAVTLYRQQAADNPAYLPDLARALNNLGVCYREVGRRAEAMTSTEEAVRLYREQVAETPMYLPDLARALTNLGVCYREVGQRVKAVSPTEEAVALCRDLADENPAHLLDLARALTNLGNRYSKAGWRAEAVSPTEEAVALCRDLADENPIHLLDLARALTNLGNRYSEVGRRAEAVVPTEEAVSLYRQQAADNPAYLPDLARALTSLGICYREAGRRADAIAPTEEAVSLYRQQAETNPAYLPDLAAALNNLGVSYREVGRRAEAITSTEQAIVLYRQQAEANPAYLPDLAAALNNLGAFYREGGRRADAVTPAEEAVKLRRQQADENPAFVPDLAGTLNNLGLCYTEVGRRTDAITPTEEAVALYREQAAANPAYLPDLAMALTNLGLCYAEVGLRTDAITLTQQAVALYRQQAADNPAYLPNLAWALANLGNRYAELGRGVDVELAWQETLDALLAPAQTFLLLRRAESRPPDDPAAFDDVDCALALAPQDAHRLIAGCHAVCRRLRARDPVAFDAAWSQRHPGDLPPWLLLDDAHLVLTREWVATNTVAAEKQFLDEHPELLTDVTATALDEIGLEQGDPAAVDVYRSLLQRARSDGIDEAYRLRLASALLAKWINADLDTTRAMLTEQRDELLGDDVAEMLDSWRQDDPDDESLIGHEALLTLVSAGHEDAAFDGLADPDRLPGLLTELARAGAEPATLAAAATLTLAVDDRDGPQACALFHRAIALVTDDQPEEAERALARAYELDATQLPAWMSLLVELAPRHSQIQTLSQTLLRLTQPEIGQR